MSTQGSDESGNPIQRKTGEDVGRQVDPLQKTFDSMKIGECSGFIGALIGLGRVLRRCRRA